MVLIAVTYVSFFLITSPLISNYLIIIIIIIFIIINKRSNGRNQLLLSNSC